MTGHPKGAAGAWMLNGAIQILESGLVPGNRNADNVDKLLEQYEYVLYPSRSIQTDGIKAVSVTSFGFGQKVHRLLLFIQITYLLFWIDPLMKNMLLRSLLEIKDLPLHAQCNHQKHYVCCQRQSSI